MAHDSFTMTIVTIIFSSVVSMIVGIITWMVTKMGVERHLKRVDDIQDSHQKLALHVASSVYTKRESDDKLQSALEPIKTGQDTIESKLNIILEHLVNK